MAHFSEGVWADVVRGVASDSDREAVHAHLDAGCEECSSEMAVWKQFTGIAKSLRSCAPPDGTVRQILAEFAFQQAKRENRVIAPMLVFDTLGQGALAGVRAGALATRQMLFESDEVSVDLRVERRHTSKKISVIGQVLEKKGVPGKALPFRVTSEQGRWGLMSLTSEFGEFHFEIAAEDPATIVVELPGNRLVELPLRDLQISLPR